MPFSFRYFFSIALLAGATTSAGAADYSVTLVGVGPMQAPVVATGINGSGDVTGFTAGDPMFAFEFLSIDRQGPELGTFAGGSISLAFGINNSNQITGYANAPSATLPEPQHAFVYSQGVMTDLGTLGGDLSEGYGINSSAEVTGFSYLADNTTRHAFLYANGVMTDLGVLPGTAESSGTGINDAGEVVGETYLAGGYNYHAFLYANGVMTDLGTLGGPVSSATAINDAGQVAGYASLATYAHYEPDGTGIGVPAVHAFLYANGSMIDLGTLGGDNSQADALNDFGQVVGESEFISNDVDEHAFLYSDGVMMDLNTLIAPDSGWVLQEAVGINDAREIVGNGMFDGQEEAFLLTPAASPGVPVPEPASFAILGFAVVGLVWRRRWG